MARFGWTQLAQLVITLVVLAFVVKLGPLAASAVTEHTVGSSFSVTQVETSTSGDLEDQESRILETDNIPKQDTDDGEHAGHDHSATSGLYENVDFEGEAPVFYRPVENAAVASRGSSPSTGGPGERVCKNVSAAPAGAQIVFPLTRDHFDSYEDTWGAARSQGGHEGTDLMVADGTPLIAVTDATVVPVSGANENGWNSLGGYTTMLRADNSIGPVEEGDLFYYAHMNRPASIEIGDKVEVGDVVGYAGDTGEGPEGTSGRFPTHLHLGWYDVGSDRSQVASGAMNPYPLLEWIKANGGSIEGGSDIPYCEAPQPATPILSGGGSWPYPTDPGLRPDMDTGTQNAAPTPAARPAPSAESSPNVTPNEESSRPEKNRKNDTNDTDRANNVRAIIEKRLNERIGRPDATPDADASVDGGSANAKPDRSARRDDEPEKNENGATDEPGIGPNDDAGPFRNFPSLTREEKIQSLLRLERLGVNISRFENWLERALEAEKSDPEPPENPENIETTDSAKDPETTDTSVGESDGETTDDEACDIRESTCEDANDNTEASETEENEAEDESTTEDSSPERPNNPEDSKEATEDAPLTEITEGSGSKPVDDKTGEAADDVSGDGEPAPETPESEPSGTDTRLEDSDTGELSREATARD